MGSPNVVKTVCPSVLAPITMQKPAFEQATLRATATVRMMLSDGVTTAAPTVEQTGQM